MMISWFNVRSLGTPEKSTMGGHAWGNGTTMAFYIRDWSMHVFYYLRGRVETNSPELQNNYTLIIEEDVEIQFVYQQVNSRHTILAT